MGSLCLSFIKPLTSPGPFRHLPMGLLLSSVVAVLSSMLGGGFLVARRSRVPQRKDDTPPFSTVGGLKLVTRSELLLEADNTSRTEPELPRVKTEESGGSRCLFIIVLWAEKCKRCNAQHRSATRRVVRSRGPGFIGDRAGTHQGSRGLLAPAVLSKHGIHSGSP